MESIRIKRIYISSIETDYCYENVKKVLDMYLLNVGDKESVRIVCLEPLDTL